MSSITPRLDLPSMINTRLTDEQKTIDSQKKILNVMSGEQETVADILKDDSDNIIIRVGDEISSFPKSAIPNMNSNYPCNQLINELDNVNESNVYKLEIVNLKNISTLSNTYITTDDAIKIFEGKYGNVIVASLTYNFPSKITSNAITTVVGSLASVPASEEHCNGDPIKVYRIEKAILKEPRPEPRPEPTVKSEGNVLEDIFSTLSSVYDKITHSWGKVEVSKDTFGKLNNLNEELGRLYYVINQKKLYLATALMAPVGIMVGGSLIGGGNEYVAPDRPSRAIYSTARIIANILKRYENEIVEVLGKSSAKDLEKLIVDVHKQEQELFIKIAQMDELRLLLETGDIDDLGVKTLENLVKDARDAHEKANKKRQEAFNKIGNSLVAVGVPHGGIAFLH